MVAHAVWMPMRLYQGSRTVSAMASGRCADARERQADVVYVDVLNRRTARMPRPCWTGRVT
jgi:hypothetical protein